MRSKKKCHRYSKKKKNFSNDYVRMTIITRQACKVIKKKKKKQESNVIFKVQDLELLCCLDISNTHDIFRHGEKLNQRTYVNEFRYVRTRFYNDR